MIENKTLGAAIRRMGEPSWLILHTLSVTTPMPRYEIFKRIMQLYKEAKYPSDVTVDPSTLTYGLRRLIKDNLVGIFDFSKVKVPGPHGSSRWEIQPRYVRTELGTEAVQTRDRLYTILLKVERD